MDKQSSNSTAMLSLQQYEARARVAKSLAHVSRLLILDHLSREPMSVQQLTKLVGADQSTVSKHLAVLKEVGLVNAEKQGSSRFYSLSCDCLNHFFDCLDSVAMQDAKSRCQIILDSESET